MNQKSQSGPFSMRGYSKMKLPVPNTNSLTSTDMIMPPDLDLDPAAIIFTTDTGARRSLRLISTNQLEEPLPDDVKGEVFGVILSRKSPSGHSDSRRFGHPGHDQRFSSSSSSSSLHSAVRRVFSMKRSCSVSERYCRIHDNFFPLSPHHDHHAGDGGAPPVWMGSSSKKKKVQLTNSKLLKACKRIFGL